MKRLAGILLSALIFVGMIVPLSAQEENQDFDLSSIDTLTQEQMDKDIFPGASVLIKLGDEILFNKSYGYSYLYDMGTKLDHPIPTTNDTIYDLASVTKVTATTQAVMILVYRGELDLDEAVSTYWSGFGNNGKEEVTARDLLTHTSGLTPWEPTFLYGNTRAQEKEYIEKLGLVYNTGEKYSYSDFSFMSLAFLVEEITKQPIEDFLEENLYGPLGMNDTMFTPLTHGVDINRIAATSWGNPYEWRMSNEAEYPGVGYDTSKDAQAFLDFDGWREYTLVGEVNDGNAGMANEGIAGHAGLFSTTKDLSVLADLMLQGGTLNGVTIYDQETIDIFTAADVDRFDRGLGWQVGGARESSGYVGRYATESVYSHAGFTGTQFIIDGEYGLSVTILTNKQNNGPTNDKGSYASPYAYSRNVMNLVYEEIYKNEEVLRDYLSNLIIVENKNYDQTQYDSYMDTVESIQALSLDDLKYPELKEAYSNLVQAVESLTELDYTELDILLEKVKNTNKELYTKESWNKLETVYNQTVEVYKTLTTQASIEEQMDLLSTAFDGLEKVKEEVETPEVPKEEKEKETTTSPKDNSDTLPNTGMTDPYNYLGLGLLAMGSMFVLIKRVKN